MSKVKKQINNISIRWDGEQRRWICYTPDNLFVGSFPGFKTGFQKACYLALTTTDYISDKRRLSLIRHHVIPNERTIYRHRQGITF